MGVYNKTEGYYMERSKYTTQGGWKTRTFANLSLRKFNGYTIISII